MGALCDEHFVKGEYCDVWLHVTPLHPLSEEGIVYYENEHLLQNQPVRLGLVWTDMVQSQSTDLKTRSSGDVTHKMLACVVYFTQF